jgi:hypothetical protein
MRRCLAALGLVLAGCATVINDQKETIAVSSEPAGAVVTVNCGSSAMYGGLTPASILIERIADPCAFTIAKDGYREKRVELRRLTSAATIGNKVPGIIAGSLLSVVGLLVTPDSNWIDPLDVAQSGWEIGSAIGEAPGNAIDRKTGAAYKHVPAKISVKLEPSGDGR